MRKFVLTHDFEELDHPRVEQARRALENESAIVVCKSWFSTSERRMIAEVEAKDAETAREAFERLELPASQILEATELIMRARVIPVVHT